MNPVRRVKILFALFALIFQSTLISHAASANQTTDGRPAPVLESKEVKPTEPGAPLAATPRLAPVKEDVSRWELLLPAFVMHGFLPTDGANEQMPRRLTDDGRFVATPGFGLEYENANSLDILAGAFKDCYDDLAGTIQIGQYMKLGKNTRLGYTVGLYIRQTPINCLTETTVVSTGGGHGHAPPNQNSFSATSCGVEDNLPFRYTTIFNGQYVDIIPTPFINFSTSLYDGSFKVDFKFLSNIYLNEFGLSFPF